MEPKIEVTRRRGGKTTATITFMGTVVTFDPGNAEELHSVLDQMFRILHQLHSPEEVQRIGENIMAQLGWNKVPDGSAKRIS